MFLLGMLTMYLLSGVIVLGELIATSEGPEDDANAFTLIMVMFLIVLIWPLINYVVLQDAEQAEKLNEKLCKEEAKEEADEDEHHNCPGCSVDLD